MLTHSPSTTSNGHSPAVGLSSQKQDFNVYVPRPVASDFDKDEGFGRAEIGVRPNTPPTKRSSSCFEGIGNFYRAVTRMCGFNEKYSLGLLIFFGGALIGFCLARTLMMSPANLRDLTIPGEWFWYRQSVFKPCIFIHVYLSIISGIFAVFQFVPAIRRRSVILHRINGYMTVALLIPSTVCGSVVARRAFGGELNVQSAFYVDGCLIVSASLTGLFYAKRNTRKHRKWMLRTVAYAAVPITARLTSIAARHIVSVIGSYYALWRCEEISWVLNSVAAAQQSYPQCTPSQAGDDLASVRVAIRAAADGDKLGLGSSVRVTWGMSMWVAIVIHSLGVETYIRLSESSNRYRRGFVLQRDGDVIEEWPDDD